MRNIQYYFCALALYLCFAAFPSPALAEDDGMHVQNNIEGLWATPDCRAPEELHFYSKHFQIRTDTDNTLHMTPVHVLLKQKEYSVITIDDKQIPSRVLEDGVLQFVDVEDTSNYSKSWDDLPIIRYHEYMHCLDTDLPKKLEKFMTLSTQLDAVYPYCQYSLSDDCQEKLFAAYMPSTGNTVSKDDLIKILDDIAILASLHKDMTADTTAIAAALMSVFDTDHSESLSLQEIQSAENIWDAPALTGPARHQLVNLLKAVSSYFPSLRIAETEAEDPGL